MANLRSLNEKAPHDEEAGDADYREDTLKSDSLVDQLFELLRNDIINGKIAQGEKITEIKLAQQLRISRNPIREAVRRLEGVGLLVNHPRRGRFVREISREEADDIMFFRTGIECAVIREAAATRSPGDLTRLRDILDRMHAAAAAGDIAATFALDTEFHRTICEISRSRRSLRAFDEIHGELRMLLGMMGTIFSTLEDAAAAHEPMLDAIAAGDRERAGQLMADHIKSTHLEVERYFQRLNTT